MGKALQVVLNTCNEIESSQVGSALSHDYMFKLVIDNRDRADLDFQKLDLGGDFK